MRFSREPGPSDRVSTHERIVAEQGEILVPHDPQAGPVTAVRNILLNSSIAQLQANGHFERYATLIAKDVLDDLLVRIGPGWAPVELALAHYEACENLNLNHDETNAAGSSVGTRLKDTTLVSRAKKAPTEGGDLITLHMQLYRMWARLFQGGSVQITKLDEKHELLEQRGFVMNRYRYFREGQISASVAAYASVGRGVKRMKLVRYDPIRDEAVYHITWE